MVIRKKKSGIEEELDTQILLAPDSLVEQEEKLQATALAAMKANAAMEEERIKLDEMREKLAAEVAAVHYNVKVGDFLRVKEYDEEMIIKVIRVGVYKFSHYSDYSYESERDIKNNAERRKANVVIRRKDIQVAGEQYNKTGKPKLERGAKYMSKKDAVLYHFQPAYRAFEVMPVDAVQQFLQNGQKKEKSELQKKLAGLTKEQLEKALKAVEG